MIIVHVYGLFEWMWSCACFLSFVNICITVADTIIKSGRFGILL